MMRKLGCPLVAWLLLVAVAAGRDIHVDNVAGDDGFTGWQSRNLPDRTGPVKTIARALQLAGSGDRIVLAKTDQPYRESISLVGSRHSGYPGHPFTIEGNGAILDGSTPVPPEAWVHHAGAVFRFRPPMPAHQQLFRDDRPLARVVAATTSVALPELKKLQWCLHAGYVYFHVEPNKLPADYNLSCAGLQTGITLFHVRKVAVVDLIVQGYQLDGINLHNSARDVYLAGITARGNGRGGITVGGASRVEIDGCVVGNNGRAQLLTLPLSETTVHGSQLFSNTAPAWVDRGGRVYIDGKLVEGGLDAARPMR